MERSLLHEHGRYGAAALVEPCFHRCTAGGHVGVGAQIEGGVCSEQHSLEQLVDVDVLLGGDIDEHRVAAVLLRNEPEFGELTAHLLRVGSRHINLVNSHDDRHVGGLRVVDCLDGLGHDAIIRSDHEDRDIRELGATGTHCREGFVTRGIEERDLALFAVQMHGHLVSADALRDTAGFLQRHVRLADCVEQAGLTMIDVAHDGHDRRTRHEVFIIHVLLVVKVDVELLEQLLVFLFGRNDLDVPADFLAQNLERVLVEGLRCRRHLTQVEQHGDQRSGAHVDLLSKVSKAGALAQANRLAMTGRNAHATDDRCLHLLVFLLLSAAGILTSLGRTTALMAECTCCTAATATRTSARTAVAAVPCRTVIGMRRAGTEMACACCASALACAGMSPAPADTLARTAIAGPRTSIAAMRVVDRGARHRVRTRNVVRRGHMHALVARERVVARTRRLFA